MTVTAKVSEVDYKKGSVKVILTDRDNIVSDWLPMLSYEYEMPDIGDVVTCDFVDNYCKVGFCKGRYFNDAASPIKHGKDTYHKLLLKDADIEYDRAAKEFIFRVDNIKIIAKTLKVKADIEIKGDVRIEGDLEIKGNLAATSTIHSNSGVTTVQDMQANAFVVPGVPPIPVLGVVIE